MSLSIAPLFSSSSGNCTFICSEKCSLLVDAGLAGKYIEQALSAIGRSPAELSAILVTHEHMDHIKGVGVLSRRYGIPVYANEETWGEMEGKIGPIPLKNMRVIDENDFFLSDICVTPIPISHDAARPFGYSFVCGKPKISILTDTGKFTREMLCALGGSNIVMLEANHDVDMLKNGSYPYRLKKRILSTHGHLSNDDAGTAAVSLAERGTKGIILAHLSKENNEESIAYGTVSQSLTAAGIVPAKDIALKTTKKYQVTGLYTLK